MAESDSVSVLRDGCKRFGVDSDNIVFACVIGSRLWGTARRDSDFDILVVHRAVRGSKPAKAKAGKKGGGKSARGGGAGGPGTDSRSEKTESGRRMVHQGKFDGLLMEQADFQRACTRGSFLELAALFAPDQIGSASEACGGMPEINTKIMLDCVRAEVERDWARAQKAFGKGQLAKAKKVVGATIREAKLAAALATTGTIADATSANDVHYMLLSDRIADWDEFAAMYHPLVLEAVDELSTACGLQSTRPLVLPVKPARK